MPNDPNLISYGPSSTSISGPDAMLFYRACVLRTGIKLYAKTGIKPSRNVTPAVMRAIAAEITKKTYPPRVAWDVLIADLDVWIETMRAAIPRERKELDGTIHQI